MNKLVSKSARGINEQLLKTSGADVLTSRKKLRKPDGGSIHPHPHPPPLLYVQGLSVCNWYSFFLNVELRDLSFHNTLQQTSKPIWTIFRCTKIKIKANNLIILRLNWSTKKHLSFLKTLWKKCDDNIFTRINASPKKRRPRAKAPRLGQKNYCRGTRAESGLSLIDFTFTTFSNKDNDLGFSPILCACKDGWIILCWVKVVFVYKTYFLWDWTSVNVVSSLAAPSDHSRWSYCFAPSSCVKRSNVVWDV